MEETIKTLIKCTEINYDSIEMLTDSVEKLFTLVKDTRKELDDIKQCIDKINKSCIS